MTEIRAIRYKYTADERTYAKLCLTPMYIDIIRFGIRTERLALAFESHIWTGGLRMYPHVLCSGISQVINVGRFPHMTSGPLGKFKIRILEVFFKLGNVE